MGFQGVASGMQTAVDQKTPQQNSRIQGNDNLSNQGRPLTGVVNSATSGSHKIQSSQSNKGSLMNQKEAQSLKNQSSEKSQLAQNAGGQQ